MMEIVAAQNGSARFQITLTRSSGFILAVKLVICVAIQIVCALIVKQYDGTRAKRDLPIDTTYVSDSLSIFHSLYN